MRSVRQLSFKTIGKNGTKSVSFKTIDKSGTKQVPFKTTDKSGTNRVSFKTMEETNKKLISFKTFDDWIKARTAKYDTALKDALSFVSGKRSALDEEKDSPQARPAPPVRSNPSHTEPSSQQTNSDPQPPRET